MFIRIANHTKDGHCALAALFFDTSGNLICGFAHFHPALLEEPALNSFTVLLALQLADYLQANPCSIHSRFPNLPSTIGQSIWPSAQARVKVMLKKITVSSWRLISTADYLRPLEFAQQALDTTQNVSLNLQFPLCTSCCAIPLLTGPLSSNSHPQNMDAVVASRKARALSLSSSSTSSSPLSSSSAPTIKLANPPISSSMSIQKTPVATSLSSSSSSLSTASSCLNSAPKGESSCSSSTASTSSASPSEFRTRSSLLKVYFDGACRRNPGPGAAGACIFDDQDRLVARAYQFVGCPVTNNVAEYAGIILGMSLAAKFRAAKYLVYGDSLLVINQITGKWRCKHKQMQRYLPMAKEATPPNTQFFHVVRSFNAMADELANKGLLLSREGETVTEVMTDCPSLIRVSGTASKRKSDD
eukprot:m.4690 g.4690  ORF g.4690 m.4690 type:complete len:416 (+) comp5135_c0_seq1:55-1302(+)